MVLKKVLGQHFVVNPTHTIKRTIMTKVVDWVIGRLSEPSTYAAASVVALGAWAWTSETNWIVVSAVLAVVAIVVHEKA
jgi:hypothetical protein